MSCEREERLRRRIICECREVRGEEERERERRRFVCQCRECREERRRHNDW